MKARRWLLLVGLLLVVAVVALVLRQPFASVRTPASGQGPTAALAAPQTAPAPTPAPAETATATATAKSILAALVAHDGETLAKYVAPPGVRLSPSAFVDPETDRILSPDAIRNLWTDRRVMVWGAAEASGDPISMTAAAYIDHFALDQDYGNAEIRVNDGRPKGTTNSNIAAIYPGATSVEFFKQGRHEQDWSALRLVLTNSAAGWRLVGIVHESWSP